MPKTKADKHGDATTTIRTRKDPKDGFTRTALVIENADTGSIDVVDTNGNRLCQLNIAYQPNASDGLEWLNVDVIDVDERFTKRRMLAFSRGERKNMDMPEGGIIAAVEFTRKAKK